MGQRSISVLIPNCNHGRFLAETVNALLNQSYSPAEIIVVDDASTDNSREILEHFSQKHETFRAVFNKRNMGVEFTVNRLLELATGDYVYFIGADDKAFPGLFEKSMAMLAKYPEAGFCSALCMRITEDGKNLGLMGTPIVAEEPTFFSPADVRKLLSTRGSWFHGLTIVHRRAAIVAAGGFNIKLGSYCDSFLYQVIALRHGVCFIPEPLAAWRKMDAGYSSMTMADTAKAREIIDYAVQLMGSPEYGDLFPYGYAEDYRKQQLFWLGMAALERMHSQQASLMKRLDHAISRRRPCDRAVFRLLSTLMSLPGLAANLYLFLRNFNLPLVRFICSWLFGKGWGMQSHEPRAALPPVIGPSREETRPRTENK